MPEREDRPSRSGYAPFAHVTRVQAVRDFVDWLYDASPDPPSMPREKLVHAYWNRVASEAMQSADVEPATHADVERWHASGDLHRALGLPAPRKVLPFPSPDADLR